MQILPGNSTAQSVAGSNPLFGSGGLFGNNAGQAGGLFGALFAMFGQSQAQAGNTININSAAGTGTQLLQGQLLPAIEGQAQGETALDLNALINLLQQAAAGQPVSPELKKILAENPADAQSLQQELAGLDDEQRETVIAEIATLLQPLLVQQAQPAAPAQASLDAASGVNPVITADPKQSPLAAAPERTPAPDRNTAPASAAADLPVPDDSSLKAGVKDQGPVNGALTSASSASAASTANQTAAAAALQAQSSTAATPEKGEKKTETGNKAPAPVTAAGPSQQAAAETAKTKPASQTAQAAPAAADKPAADTTDKPQLNVTAKTAEGLQTTEIQTAPPAPEKASFASHLENVKLNRTGAHQPVSEQVAVHLTRAAQSGQDKMTIRLQPPELGRIDIKLDISTDGMIKASIQVDQAATLDLMLRDQKGLEKAFTDAGLKTDGNSLNFNLRGDGMPQRQQGGEQQAGQNNGNQNGNGGFGLNGEEAEGQPAGVMEMTWFISPDRVDVRI